MSTATATQYTPEDLLTMPDGNRYELVDGQLLEKPMGAKSDWVGMQLIAQLIGFVRGSRSGEIFGPETGYRCFREDSRKVRKPDGTFVASSRMPHDRIPDGHITVPPDLAFEVISPNDTYYEVEAKVHEYLDAGVRLVWVLNPDLRTIRVYEGTTGALSELSVSDELTGGDILPGFRCPVSELFPPDPAGQVE
ncbi:MAG: Uma2 family endonuclease [Planctomycetaceae bacterium]